MKLDRTLVLACAAFVLCVSAARAEVVDPGAHYPEGAMWWNGKLFYTEMGADQVAYVDAAGKHVFWRERGCGPTALAPYGDGFVILCHPRAQVVALDGAGRVSRRWDAKLDGDGLQDPNDAASDGRGGVYLSDPGIFSRDAPTTGEVLHLSPQGVLRRVAENLRYPNGVFVDPRENVLFVNEHLNRRVLRFPILPDGALGRAVVFTDLDKIAPREGDYREAGPDGLERGPDGDLYVCLYGEGRIVRLNASGALVRSIKVATPYVTSISFGPDGSAFVTGAFDNLTRPFPGQVVRLGPETLRATGRGG